MSGKQFLYIVIATFITVIIWFALEIKHASLEVTTPPDIQQLLQPVNPNFDQKTINDL